MEAKAIAKTVRISADKARLVMKLITTKKVADALVILKNQTQKAARLIEKVVISATANAENNLKLKQEDLYIKEGYVNDGPVMKRPMFDSRGRMGRQDKRTSHITIIVTDKK